MTNNNEEHCAVCGAVPLYRTISTATLDDPTSKQQVAFRCSDSRCENADPRNHTFGWVQ